MIGGPIYSVSIEDHLKTDTVPRNTSLFTFENADEDTIIARKRKGKSRLRRNGTDVTFYKSEGIMQVASG